MFIDLEFGDLVEPLTAIPKPVRQRTADRQTTDSNIRTDRGSSVVMTTLLSVVSSGFGIGSKDGLAHFERLPTDVVPGSVRPTGDSALVPVPAESRREPVALADAMVEMCHEREAWTAMGLLGRKRVEQHFEIRQMIGSYEALYEKLARRAGFGRKQPSEGGTTSGSASA